MSTLKSSAEDLTLNADGSGNDIKFQINAVEKASISSAGLLTSTTIDATVLTGDLPAISGANLTGIAATLAALTDATVSVSDPTESTNPSAVGHLWVNSTSGECYVATDATAGANVWINIGEGTGNLLPPYNIDYLIIAGGGGGGNHAAGGGGGAGGYRNSYSTETSGGGGSSETSLTIEPAITLTITIGGGGTSHSGVVPHATNGSDSVISGTGITTITSTGGGASNTGDVGRAGGSGGGGRSAGGSGTAGQGYSGGTGIGSPLYIGGGGGGAGAVGANYSGTVGGAGGSGVASLISSSSITRAGGGGGGAHTSGSTGGAGGSGGGGAGADSGWTAGVAGTINTGSGGGGAGGIQSVTAQSGGYGGSGVAILRMLTSDYSGITTGSPSVTTSGSDTILTFNGSGSYTG
jgi:hypothetical protein